MGKVPTGWLEVVVVAMTFEVGAKRGGSRVADGELNHAVEHGQGADWMAGGGGGGDGS